VEGRLSYYSLPTRSFQDDKKRDEEKENETAMPSMWGKRKLA